MNIHQIRQSIESIKEASGDDEKQHSWEDDLWENVLRAISGGAKNPDKLAKEALKTKELDFERWCA